MLNEILFIYFIILVIYRLNKNIFFIILLFILLKVLKISCENKSQWFSFSFLFYVSNLIVVLTFCLIKMFNFLYKIKYFDRGSDLLLSWNFYFVIYIK